MVISDKQVWGRPGGVVVAKDGSLFVTEDGNGTIWRVPYQQAVSRRPLSSRLSPADPGIGVAAGS
jgi:streptogramin lyase